MASEEYKASHASQVILLQEELEAERASKTRELRELEAAYQQEIRKISTEHAQKVTFCWRFEPMVQYKIKQSVVVAIIKP